MVFSRRDVLPVHAPYRRADQRVRARMRARYLRGTNLAEYLRPEHFMVELQTMSRLCSPLQATYFATCRTGRFVPPQPSC
jgi:hypothetical protein